MSFDIMPYVVIEMQTVKTYPLSLKTWYISVSDVLCLVFPDYQFWQS